MLRQDFRVWLSSPTDPTGESPSLICLLKDRLAAVEQVYAAGGDESSQALACEARFHLLMMGRRIEKRNAKFRLTGINNKTKRRLDLSAECFDGLRKIVKELCSRYSLTSEAQVKIMYSLLLEARLCPPYVTPPNGSQGQTYSFYTGSWAAFIAEKDHTFRSRIFIPYMTSLKNYNRQFRAAEACPPRLLSRNKAVSEATFLREFRANFLDLI